MDNCTNCNSRLIEAAKFCHICGTSINSTIQTKSESVSDSESLRRLMPAPYIEKLLASKGQIEGERRIVTILFSDVKGSTSLAENLDPEDVLNVMNGVFEILIQPITKYEGTLARLMGDAILAFFGAPIAHEDDPDRACLAALDIIKGSQKYAEKLKKEMGIEDFAVRVGINTGLVVVAEVGADLRVEYTAMGDAVNIAARMESAAKPGTVLITEATKKLLNPNFIIQELGAIELKGKKDPINVYQIDGFEKKEKEDLLSRKKSLLVGRDDELSLIKKVITNLRSDIGGVIAINGDVGLGKSRLIEEAKNENEEDIIWIENKAKTYLQNESYSMSHEIFDFLLKTDAVMKMLGKWKSMYKDDHELHDVPKYLNYFINSSENSSVVKKVIETQDSETLKGRMHFACRQFLKRISEKHKLILVWEDLQWCDTPSLELLYELLTLVKNKSIIFILSFRPGESQVWKYHNNKLKQKDLKYLSINLAPLQKSESDELLKHFIMDNDISADLYNQILAKTEGNPLFIDEVIHSLSEQNILCKDKNELVSQNDIRIPFSLQSLIMSRIDSLPANHKAILQSASVIGFNFNKNLLQNILSDNINITDIEMSLNELVKRDFISLKKPRNTDTNISDNDFEYLFNQYLTQSVIYDSLLLSQRKKLHRQVAETIEKLNSKNKIQFAGVLASHFEKGGVIGKSIIYYRKAADKARKIYNNKDAILFYKKVIEIVRKQNVELIDLPEVYESLGDLYHLMGEYDNAIEHYNNASKTYSDELMLSNIYYKWGCSLENFGKYENALNKLNNGLKLLTSNKDSLLSGKIYGEIAMVYFRQNYLKKAEKYSLQALEVLKKQYDKKEISNNLNNLGLIYNSKGDFKKAIVTFDESYKLRKEIEHISGLAATLNNLGYSYKMLNDYQKALKYFNESLSICKKINNSHGIARVYDNLGDLYYRLGKEDLARQFNLKAITILGNLTLRGKKVHLQVWRQSGVW